MSEYRSMLQVYFEEPFWVGLFQRWDGDGLCVSKVTFGAEPRDQEIYLFLQTHYLSLSFSPAVADTAPATHSNPKRRQRAALRALMRAGAGTKSQQALKLQQEQSKADRKQRQRFQKEADDALRYQKKQQKKKARHRGH